MLVIPGAAARTTVTASPAATSSASAAPVSSASRSPTCSHSKKPARNQQERSGQWSRLRQGQERHPGLPARRPEPPRPVGSEGQRARQREERLQADHDEAPGMQFTELLPKLAQVIDKITMIRSMSYTPNGLFNHTAAIYQMLTGYTTDKVSPSGQLEPPEPEGLPELRLEHHPAQAADRADAAVRDAAAAAAGSNVVGKGGTAGFLGKALRPVHALPAGDDMDMAKMDRIKVDDLKLREELSAGPPGAPRDAPRHHRARACRRSKRPSPSTTSTSTTARRSAWSSPAGRGRRST